MLCSTDGTKPMVLWYLPSHGWVLQARELVGRGLRQKARSTSKLSDNLTQVIVRSWVPPPQRAEHCQNKAIHKWNEN